MKTLHQTLRRTPTLAAAATLAPSARLIASPAARAT
jgi:hypothetical protein